MDAKHKPNPGAENTPPVKKRYVAPKLTVLGREEFEQELKAKSRAGSLEARELLDRLQGRRRNTNHD